MTMHIGIETLSMLLEDELSAGDAAIATTHLQDCEPCRQRMRELEAMRAAVRALPAFERPARDVWPTIVAAQRRERTRATARRTLLRAAGIAAVFVAGALSTRWWNAAPASDAIDSASVTSAGSSTPATSDAVALQDAAAEFLRRLEAVQREAGLSDAQRAAARDVALAALVRASAALEDSSSVGVALSPIVGELARMRVAVATPGRVNQVSF